MTFASSARIDFDYDDYSTAAAIRTAVSSLTQMGGNTDLGGALQLVANGLQIPSGILRVLSALLTCVFLVNFGSWK